MVRIRDASLPTGVRLAHPIGDEPERSPVGAMNHKLRQVDIGKMAERAIA